ncbi:Ankyrin repeat-containing protein [Spironucleus salmonicida]|uniref:Ankyrin repeat-containing protein n=2 Tax=Spironucleus salmonicida TaxID=348837 RepID=A0A9P8LWX1_9EUKA|nr:Ankyrin repeat-containing protein [Spironucleus salmonicida]
MPNPFLQAAIDNDIFFIKFNLSMIDETSIPAQKTALHYAAQYGNINVVKLLIPFLAAKTSSNGFTALHYAAKHGFYECVHVLAELEAGIKTANKKLAIEIAAENGELEIMTLLWKYEGGPSISAGDCQEGQEQLQRLGRKRLTNQLKKSWLVQFYCQEQGKLQQQLVRTQIEYKTQLVKVERERDILLERITYLNAAVKQDESDCEDWVKPVVQDDDEPGKGLCRNLSFLEISCSQVFNDQRKRNLIIQGHGLKKEIRQLKQISQKLLDRFEQVFENM